MAIGVSEVLQDHIQKGLLSVPTGTRNQQKLHSLPSTFTVMEGAEDNLPDEDSLRATMEIQRFVTSLSKDDILLVLISGGGSALLPAPVEEVTLNDKLSTIKLVANAGGTINQLNTIRKRLSRLKGGKLTLLSPSHNIISLIISDIVGDPLDLIASGPTVWDSSTTRDCLDIISDLNVTDSVPIEIMKFFTASSGDNDTRDIDRSIIEEKCLNFVVGSNCIALQNAARTAKKMGFNPLIVSSQIEGRATQIGQSIAKLALDVIKLKPGDCCESLLKELNVHDTHVQNDLNVMLQDHNCKKLCLIFGGETTVEVRGRGKGGRNQHLVLSALKYFIEDSLSSSRDDPDYLRGVSFLSAGTDGQDGPTDAAGAWIDVELIKHFSSDLHTVEHHLDECGSYDFFTSSEFANGYLLRTGLTGTNVMDVQLLMIERP